MRPSSPFPRQLPRPARPGFAPSAPARPASGPGSCNERVGAGVAPWVGAPYRRAWSALQRGRTLSVAIFALRSSSPSLSLPPTHSHRPPPATQVRPWQEAAGADWGRGRWRRAEAPGAGGREEGGPGECPGRAVRRRGWRACAPRLHTVSLLREVPPAVMALWASRGRWLASWVGGDGSGGGEACCRGAGAGPNGERGARSPPKKAVPPPF